MALISIALTIQAGNSLSDSCDCTDGTLVRIAAPDQWTNANLTVRISSDNLKWSELAYRNGRPFYIPVHPGTSVVVRPDEWNLKAFQYLQFRSGTRKQPIAQAGDRVFMITLDDGRPNLATQREPPDARHQPSRS